MIGEATVASIPDEELLRRAVANCRSRNHGKGVYHERWVAVMSTFTLGSTFAYQLCRRFELDPEQRVKR